MAKSSQTNDGVTFGEGLTYSSIQKVDYVLSDDKKAFQIGIVPGLAAGVGAVVFDGLTLTGAPVNTRIYSAVIPVSGKNLKTTFVLNGFGSTAPGANTKLVLTVNDQHSVTHFGPNREDQAFTATLPFQAESIIDVRITVVVIAERDSSHPDADALIVVNDVSADARVTER